MAKKQYLDLTGLTTYDEQIKSYIDAGDAATSTKLTDGTITVKEAQHAASADSATNATNATNANHATTADSATKATQDGNGKVISSTYETKTDAAAKLTEAKEYASEQCQEIVNDFGQILYRMYNNGADIDENESLLSIREIANDEATTALNSAKSYADSAAATVKNDLLNGAGTAYDTLKELGDLIDDNKDAIDALEDVAAGKANATHSHAIADVTGLQSALDGKAAASHGTHVSFDSTNTPKMDGTAAFGTSTKVARADHVHPTDTSRASQADLDALEAVVGGKADSGHTHTAASTSAAGFMTADMVTKLNGIAANANKTTVDSAMSSTSTNPVQNKIVYAELAKKATTSALDGVSSVANEAKTAAAANTQSITAHTSSINTHTSQISALQGLVGEGTEAIPTASITALFSA